ncbi:cytochrome b/b6 domain-containing protein [Polaromonas sp.]|uniref:cytochrome b/b6 domain-containing protein n=1 Tax=Polaromonas sp. TaxID=1869339 RepID=UPI0018579BED|nr:cytochrome b/b6 domain-containing protein [Polaromonas sp.]NML86085.1 cytochrome b/b6 domain-containing protein [Polaromonas sp.]
MTANTFPSSESAAAPAGLQTRAPLPASRRVVDATTRMLHWLMALSFAGAYLTADGERWRMVHVTLGYTLAGLLLCRVLWGLFGPRHARLSVLMRKLKGLPAWLKSLPAVKSPGTLQPAWRQGQNFLMALAVLLILCVVLPLTLSGYAVWDEWGGEWLENVHEFFGNAMLAVVLVHIGLIAMLSLLRRKNQALPMLTGRVAGPGPDLAKRNHGILAAVVLACVMGFWGWQWTAAPQGDAALQGTVRIDNQRNNDSD